MPAQTANNYELAFHITSNMEDSDIQKTAQTVEKLISGHGGHISLMKDPQKIRLSYPIKHQQYANFGQIQFYLEDKEQLFGINEQLRLNNNILRFILMKVAPESERDNDIVRKIAMEGRKRLRTYTPRPAAAEPKVQAPPVKEEEIEKQLEDILEKQKI